MSTEGFNQVEQLADWRAKKEAAPQEVATLLAERLDQSLVGHERCTAIIDLMNELNDTDPQQHRFVIELLAEIVSIEQPAAVSREKQQTYPIAAALARVAA